MSACDWFGCTGTAGAEIPNRYGTGVFTPCEKHRAEYEAWLHVGDDRDATRANAWLRSVETGTRRAELIAAITSGVCVHCGEIASPCCCTRDE